MQFDVTTSSGAGMGVAARSLALAAAGCRCVVMRLLCQALAVGQD